ncbi:hypothetical protein [Ruegeria sp. Ofav3-42]|uniref:hypothetical protein n=1 Tax=Ruegeria sp. Ofav3-42 TaxID=2917759 RepID=UPI001EF6AF69|nr:hypothetical protein [Ruegeria sp. Ofav3-42]MCG7519833.1 hypothetical protein [Ruegeria sp. Ofav3-42]
MNMDANITAAPNGPRDDVRQSVRALLTAASGFDRLDPDTQRQVAQSLVRISSTALNLAKEAGANPPSPLPRKVRTPLAQAQSAAGAFSNAAVDQIAPQTERILNAVSFPRFVGELITGVFKALNESNQQQIESYVELIRNVAASTDGFADANVGEMGARQWLVERFPGSFRIAGDDEPGFDDPAGMTADERAEWQAERAANQRLELAPGAEMPTEAALRTALGAPRGASLPTGNPEALVRPVRALLARNRQSMLASMVMMGMQRIVIDSGRLNASMRFHIDATSAASDDRGSRFDVRNEVQAGVKAQFGPWGASAKMKNTIGYVSTERTQTEQELNAELDLDSSVELIFRTDYVPLERLAGTGDVNRIRVNALNPTEEARIAQDRRAAREQRRTSQRNKRAEELNRGLQPTELPGDDEALDVPDPTGAQDSTEEGSNDDQTSDDGSGGDANTDESTTNSTTEGQGGTTNEDETTTT